MNRLDFIKLLVVATAGVAYLPVVESIMSDTESTPVTSDYVEMFKCSREALEAAEAVGHFEDLERHMKSVPKGYSLISVKVGLEGDDVIKDVYSVLCRFRKV